MQHAGIQASDCSTQLQQLQRAVPQRVQNKTQGVVRLSELLTGGFVSLSVPEHWPRMAAPLSRQCMTPPCWSKHAHYSPAKAKTSWFQACWISGSTSERQQLLQLVHTSIDAGNALQVDVRSRSTRNERHGGTEYCQHWASLDEGSVQLLRPSWTQRTKSSAESPTMFYARTIRTKSRRCVRGPKTKAR